MSLRGYQADTVNGVYGAWKQGHRVVFAVLPTGGGKTFVFSYILSQHTGCACVVAHRQELVSQISQSLAQCGVQHQVIGQKSIKDFIRRSHLQEFGACYVNDGARVAVAGVDTLIRKGAEIDAWRNQVTMWVIDEGHHVLLDNKWGAAVALFPNARGLLVSATPRRADGKGLGRHADGVADILIDGPSGRDLIKAGHLSEYDLYAPPSDLTLTDQDVSAATGDFIRERTVKAVKKSSIIGDVVKSYLDICPGELGVTFAPSIEICGDICTSFNAAGVPAAVVSAKTHPQVRAEAIARLKRGDYKQLINVDLFGEGFDLPAISAVSMARPTQSFSLWSQQMGRALRPAPGKTRAYIIDHVRNWERLGRVYGMPDAPQLWTLDRREKKSRGKSPGEIPLRSCPECTRVWPGFSTTCPYCGHVKEPASRATPEFVEGDLFKLDPEVLANLRGERDRIDTHPSEIKRRMEMSGAPGIAAAGAAKQHRLRQEAQAALREIIAMWAGVEKARGAEDSESYRKFYHTFGVDVMTAQTLGRRDAITLAEKIQKARFN